MNTISSLCKGTPATHKMLLTTAIAVFGCIGTATTAFADNGNITIMGEIVANTCVISDKTRDLVVTMPVVNSSEFPTVGTYVGDQPFTIVLEKCPKTITYSTVRFEAQKAPGYDNIILPGGDGKGVGFSIYDKPTGLPASDQPMEIAKESRNFKLHADSNELNFSVKYRSFLQTSQINQGVLKAGGQFYVTYH